MPACFYVMITKPVSSAAALILDKEGKEQAFEAIVNRFPPRSMRRMSHLGVYLATLFEDTPTNGIDEIVYATSFSESRSLENYLESFPYASPTWFQMSIHPGGIEQVLIKRKQEVRGLYPLAGLTHLVSTSCKLLLAGRSADCLLAGGEESASWMTEAGLASADDFAFLLRCSETGLPEGSLSWDPDSAHQEGKEPSLLALATAICNRDPMEWFSPLGAFSLSWNSKDVLD